MHPLLQKLTGVDRRSIGKANEVVAEVLAAPNLFGILFTGMLNDDPVLGDPRLLIRCQQPVVVQGLFGIKREATHIGLTVDDEKTFLETLQQRLGKM